MADADTSQGKTAAPYIAFSTIKTFIAPLKEHVLPNRIDKSLLKSFSGAVQTQLMTSLRFLQLTYEDGRPSNNLKTMVEAYGTESWPACLGELLRLCYSDLFKLPLEAVSPSEFSDAFKKAYPCEGETLRKGVTFFLNAARDANIPLSPYLTKNSKPRSGPVRRRKPAGRKSYSASTTHDAVQSDDVSGRRNERPTRDRLLEKFPAFDPNWPSEIQAKWFAAYEKLLKINQN